MIYFLFFDAHSILLFDFCSCPLHIKQIYILHIYAIDQIHHVPKN